MQSSDSKTPGFSETYWNLHRNSLLFSTALLVFSFPNVRLNPDQKFLIFQANHVAEPLILVGLLAAATYAFFAYFAEWRLEAKSQLQEVKGFLPKASEQIAEIRTAVADQIAIVTQHKNIASERFAAAMAELDSLLSTYASGAVITAEEEQQRMNQLQHEAMKQLGRSFAAYLEKLETDPERKQLFKATAEVEISWVDGIGSAVGELAQGVCSMRMAHFAPPQILTLRNAIEAAAKEETSFNRSVDALVKPLRDEEKRFAVLGRLLNVQRRQATARIVIIGAAVPIILYGASALAALIRLVRPWAELLLAKL